MSTNELRSYKFIPIISGIIYNTFRNTTITDSNKYNTIVDLLKMYETVDKNTIEYEHMIYDMNEIKRLIEYQQLHNDTISQALNYIEAVWLYTKVSY
jgi:hypothetical protein